MAEEGDVSQFFSDDLLRLYEVMDEFYDEYLDRTKELRPTDEEKEETKREENSAEKKKKKKNHEFNIQRDLHLKSIEEAKCLNKLQIRNRKRVRELTERLDLSRKARD